MPRANLMPRRVEPTEDGARLRIVWPDGHVSEYEPRPLRLACPCAGCIDEYTGRPLLDPDTIEPGINPLAIEYVGRYALKFTWPDGHDTGMYPFDLLRRLCPCPACAPTRTDAPEGEAMAGDDDGAEGAPPT